MATELMPTEIFLEQYRLTTTAGGKPVEIGRNGPAITYRASDQKSGAPVALTIVPIDSVDPDERERFEEKARTAMLLDHINIAKTVTFGRTDDSFVLVSEYPPGETVEEWVRGNGPMPPDAVLRVALQVVAALGTATFHGLSHPAIQPANLVIVRGKTAEGGWPFVKLTHFALSGLKSAPHHTEPDVSASDFASPEQLLQGQIDFRSEIYSLGATMCFLLTGVFYSAYPRSPQTKRFTRPLRSLISRTLEDDPAQRPQDPVLFTEELRACLAAIERRQALRRRFGLPFSPVVAKPARKRRIRQAKPTSLLAPIGQKPTPAEVVRPAPPRWRPAWAVAGGVLALAVIAALFLPEDVVTAAFHRSKPKPLEAIGVPVGVPEASPAEAVQPNANPASSTPSQNSRVAGAPAVSSSNPANTPSASPQVARNEPSPAVAPRNEDGGSVNRRYLSAPVIAEQNAVAANEPPPASSQSQPNDATKPSTPPAVVASNAPASAHAEATVPHMDHELATAPTATPATVVANNVTPEPAPPAESADENVAARSNEASGASKSTEQTPEVAHNSSTENQASAEKAPGSSNSTATTKSRSRKSPTVAQHRSSPAARVPRALPVDPDSEPPVRGETVRARVIGTTPGGNLILLMPNGDRAIVTPEDADAYTRLDQSHRRPRRVIIERQTNPSQYPSVPYQPFLPPGT